jgi:Tfp pilus assembly protein PilV
MDKIITSDRGASLIEICVVLVIITMTTLIIMSFTRSTLGMAKDTRQRDAAFMAAEDKLAELAGQPNPITEPHEDVITIDNIHYTRSWEVVDNYNSYIKRAMVTVFYGEVRSNGKRPHITLAGAIN